MKKLITLAVGASLLASVSFAESDTDAFVGALMKYSPLTTTGMALVYGGTTSLLLQEVQDNKPDALEFIKTDGQVKSERLNSLMTELRKIDGNQTKSDTELAIDIVNAQLEQAE